ncbi:hypothetical protein J6590_037836 [Homalodisca vitripennis]|nr:hypothetical protein J6590_037836 [Homalodisca vitripennis]
MGYQVLRIKVWKPHLENTSWMLRLENFVWGIKSCESRFGSLILGIRLGGYVLRISSGASSLVNQGLEAISWELHLVVIGGGEGLAPEPVSRRPSQPLERSSSLALTQPVGRPTRVTGEGLEFIPLFHLKKGKGD